MIHSNCKWNLFLGIISTLIMPFLTFCFIGLSIVRIEIGLDLFSICYTVIDLLYPFFFLLLYVGNLCLLKRIIQKKPFDRHSISTFQFLIKSNFIVFAFLALSTMIFSSEPNSELAYTFWLACFIVGLLLNISIGLYLMIQARSERKYNLFWIGFVFVMAQFFDYSGYRVLLVLTENISPDFIWNYIGLSFFDYESMHSEIKSMFDEIASMSLFITLSFGAMVVLLRTVALAIFYALTTPLLYNQNKAKRI